MGEPTEESSDSNRCSRCNTALGAEESERKGGFFLCGGGTKSKSKKVQPSEGSSEPRAFPALGTVFCGDCFVCSNSSCRSPLKGGFCEVDGCLFCKKCKGPIALAMSEKQAKAVRDEVERRMLRASRRSIMASSEKTAAAAVFKGSFKWHHKRSLHWIGRDTVESVHRLLPDGKPAEPALVFIEDREDKLDGPVLEQQVRDATTWVLDALCHAYEDDRIKTAARQLLATATYSCNLDAVHYTTDPPLRCFSDFLKPGLEARLVKLGQRLSIDYIAKDLRSAFAPERVTAAVGDPRQHPLARNLGSRSHPTQIDVLPCDPSGKYVDFSKPWTFPDSVFAHALLMVAHATDLFFQQRLDVVLALHNRKYMKGKGTAKLHPAPRKAFPRVFTKMRSDYRHEEPPRAQYNVDLIRSLATAKTAPELLSLASFCTAAFGGVTKVKNLAATSPAERAERFNLLPLMLTVNIQVGLTYAEFVKLPEVKKKVQEYIDHRSAGVPRHRWETTTSAAWAMLQSKELANVPVQLLGEIQLVLEGHAKIRNQMHEVYKAWRAESEMLLHRDFFDAAGRDAIPEDAAPQTIQQAAVFECLPEVERLIAENKSAIDEQDHYGQTGLFISAESGHTDIVKVLIEANANVDKPRKDGATPLHVAAQNGEDGSVKLLIQAGAGLDIAQKENGTTPLWIASESGHADVVKLLLEAGAGKGKGKGKTHKGNGTVRVFQPSTAGITPLDVAVQNHHYAIVKLLAEAGASIDQPRADSGVSQLGFAAQTGDPELTQILIDAGADPNRVQKDTGTTPLLAAVEQCHADVAKILLAGGADPNTARPNGLTPLGAAVQRCRPALVGLLVRAKADPNIVRPDGISQLMLSAQVGDELSMKHLLGAGATVDYEHPTTGTTALIAAVNAGEREAVEILLEHRANPNHSCPNGVTPLQIATQRGHLEIVTALLAAKATGPRALVKLAEKLDLAEIAALLDAALPKFECGVARNL